MPIRVVPTFNAPANGGIGFVESNVPDPLTSMAKLQQIRNAQLSNEIEKELQPYKIQALKDQAAKNAFDLNNPNQDLIKALALKSVDDTSGLTQIPLDLSSVAQPGALTAGQQDLLPQDGDIGGFTPTAAPEGPVLEQITANGAPTGFAQDLNAALKAKERDNVLDVNKIREGAKAKLEFYRNPQRQYVSPDGKQSSWFIPGQEPEGWSAPVKSGGAGGMLTENARHKIINQYADLTGIDPAKVVDDLNNGSISTERMTAVVGGMQGAREIGSSEIKSFEVHSSLKSDFQKVSDAIVKIESKFGPLSGRWEEFLARYPVADQDPEVAEVFAMINSLAADQIHAKYGGALTSNESKRADKWALDTALPIQTLKARIKAANSQIDSHMGSLRKTLDARHIRAPELFKDTKDGKDSGKEVVNFIDSTGAPQTVFKENLEKARQRDPGLKVVQ